MGSASSTALRLAPNQEEKDVLRRLDRSRSKWLVRYTIKKPNQLVYLHLNNTLEKTRPQKYANYLTAKQIRAALGKLQLYLDEDDLVIAMDVLGCTTEYWEDNEPLFDYRPLILYMYPRSIGKFDKVVLSKPLNSGPRVTVLECSRDQRLEQAPIPEPIDIWLAAKRGDLKSIQQELASANPRVRHDQLDAFGNTVIYYGCLCGHLDIVHDFLQRYDGTLPRDQFERCCKNALNKDIRDLLNGKRSYEELTKQMLEDDDDDDCWGGGFAMFSEED